VGHNVGKAAENAVKRSERVKLEDLTPDQIINNIRNSIPGNLHIVTSHIAILLEQFDSRHQQILALENEVANAKDKIKDLMTSNLEAMKQANGEIESLRAQNEEFREVYEAENRRSIVTTSRVGEDGADKASVSVETPGILGPAAVATAAGATAATEA
jgi:hypothetical protein